MRPTSAQRPTRAARKTAPSRPVADGRTRVRRALLLAMTVVVLVGWILMLRWLDEEPVKPAAATRTPGVPFAAPRTAERPSAPAPPVPRVSGLPRNALPVAAPPPARSGTRLVLLAPVAGATLSPTVRVKARLEGMRLAPAGTAEPDTGHLHVLIDSELPAVGGAPMPRDERHWDLGDGEAEGDIEVPPGKHRLQLVLGDGNHVPHEPPVVSEPVTITVRIGAELGTVAPQ